MTTHKYPAELSADEAEQIERAAESMRATLTQAFIAARSHKRIADDLSATLNRVRSERDTAIAEQGRLMRGMIRASRDLDTARAWAKRWKRAASRSRSLYRLMWRAMLDVDPAMASAMIYISQLERQLGETQAALGVLEAADENT